MVRQTPSTYAVESATFPLHQPQHVQHQDNLAAEGQASATEGQTGRNQALPHRCATHTLPRDSIKNLNSLGI